jgi:cobalamin biosynthesis protein CbiD
MDIRTLDNASLQKLIHDSLINADWTEDEIADISDESLKQVIDAINTRMAEKAAQHAIENQEKYKRCMEILTAVNTTLNIAANSIDELEDWQLEDFVKQIEALDLAQYVAIEKIIGPEAMTYILTGKVPTVELS